jgi:hypothetical protein
MEIFKVLLRSMAIQRKLAFVMREIKNIAGNYQKNSNKDEQVLKKEVQLYCIFIQ